MEEAFRPEHITQIVNFNDHRTAYKAMIPPQQAAGNPIDFIYAAGTVSDISRPTE